MGIVKRGPSSSNSTALRFSPLRVCMPYLNPYLEICVGGNQWRILLEDLDVWLSESVGQLEGQLYEKLHCIRAAFKKWVNRLKWAWFSMDATSQSHVVSTHFNRWWRMMYNSGQECELWDKEPPIPQSWTHWRSWVNCDSLNLKSEAKPHFPSKHFYNKKEQGYMKTLIYFMPVCWSS